MSLSLSISISLSLSLYIYIYTWHIYLYFILDGAQLFSYSTNYSNSQSSQPTVFTNCSNLQSFQLFNVSFQDFDVDFRILGQI